MLTCAPTTRDIQVVAANELAAVTEAAVPVLLERRVADGDRCFAAGATAEQAAACLERVRDRWAPAWSALDAWAAAHGAWADSIERGKPDMTQLRAAYCVVRVAIIAQVQLPDVPLDPCPVTP
jgi:hypothetical protein